MSSEAMCPQCGSAIPVGEERCPRCMLRAGLGGDAEGRSASGPFEGDRNLLFGVFAVQLRKVTPQEIMAAASAWAADATKDISVRLREQGVLSPADVEFIVRLVDEAVRAHGGDTAATLNTLGGSQVLDATYGNTVDLTRYRLGPAAGAPVYLDDKPLGLDAVPGVQETPGRYTHVSEHARGGMGRVLLVHDGFLGRNVALKELMPASRSNADPENPSTPMRQSMTFLSRFLQEARITGQLEHPSIVPVYELGHRQDGTLYYTMKLVRGKTLREAISQCKTAQERLALLAHFVDLCQAIAYAHSRGIVHRDIKPDNVMVGEFGETVVLDWGLAKAKDREDVHADGLAETIRMLHLGDVDSALKTQYGQVMGTPGYMAPEQALGRMTEVDERSDVYSLGAVLYQVLAGHPPFTGKSVQAILQRVLDHAVEPLTADTAPPELAAICMKAMAKRPEDRYTSASEMADEVRRFQTGAIVEAYSYGFAHHLQRFAKRHKAVLTTATAALLAIIALAGYSYVNIRQARDVAEIKRAEAESQREEARNAKTESDKRREAEEAARLAEAIARKKAEHNAYIAGIGLAKANLDVYNTASVRRNLMATPPHLRNWEWGYLYKAMDTSLFTLTGINSATYSPDGQHILTASQGNVAKVWDAKTGTLKRELSGHSKPVTVARYSPDGKRILTASEDTTAKVWDAETGANTLTIMGHGEAIKIAEFSPDEKYVLTASDTTFKLWNASTGEELHTLPWHPSWTTDAGFSSDGKRVFAASNNDEDNASVAYVHVWETESGKELFAKDLGTIVNRNADFSPDGSKIVTSKFAGSVWEVITGGLSVKLLSSGDAWGSTSSLSFSNDGSRVLSASWEGTAAIWDASTGKAIRTLPKHASLVSDAEFSTDDKQIVTASFDATAKISDTNSGKETKTLAGHMSRVRKASFSPDGKRVLTRSEDGTAKVWSVSAPSHWLQDVEMFSLDFSPDGKRIGGARRDENVARIWDTASGKELLVLSGHTGPVKGVGFSPDGAQVATASFDNTVRIWNAETGEVLRTFSEGLNRVHHVYFSPDGSHIVTKAWESPTTLWDARTGELVTTAEIEDFSPDGNRYLAMHEDKTVQIVDVKSGTVLLSITHQPGRIAEAVFSPDGAKIVTGGWGDDSNLIWNVWDATTGDRFCTFSAYVGTCDELGFSPDSTKVCGLADNDKACVWDINTGEVLATLSGHTDYGVEAHFSPDGTRILTESMDGTARIWDAETGEELLSLSALGHFIEDWVRFSPDGSHVLTCGYLKGCQVWSAAPWRLEDWLDEELRAELITLALRQAPEVHESTLDRSRKEVEPFLTALEAAAAAWSANTSGDIQPMAGQGIYLPKATATPVPNLPLADEDVIISVNSQPVDTTEALTGAIKQFTDAARSKPNEAHTLQIETINRYDRNLHAITIPAVTLPEAT